MSSRWPRTFAMSSLTSLPRTRSTPRATWSGSVSASFLSASLCSPVRYRPHCDLESDFVAKLTYRIDLRICHYFCCLTYDFVIRSRCVKGILSRDGVSTKTIWCTV
jgi:hypothetical protein